MILACSERVKDCVDGENCETENGEMTVDRDAADKMSQESWFHRQGKCISKWAICDFNVLKVEMTKTLETQIAHFQVTYRP